MDRAKLSRVPFFLSFLLNEVASVGIISIADFRGFTNHGRVSINYISRFSIV